MTKKEFVRLTVTLIVFHAITFAMGALFGYDRGRSTQRIESNRQIQFYKDHYVPRGF